MGLVEKSSLSTQERARQGHSALPRTSRLERPVSRLQALTLPQLSTRGGRASFPFTDAFGALRQYGTDCGPVDELKN
jgi:hypothetical protein